MEVLHKIFKGIPARTIAIILCLCTITPSITLSVNAEENIENVTVKKEIQDRTNEAAGVVAVNVRTVNDLLGQYTFRLPQGHGFAAERGNTLADRIKGKNTWVVGDNNVKNGPDRVIRNRDGSFIYIQDKYYKTAKANIDACFTETGEFRYINNDESLMLIEVPKDQYADAVECMKNKIKEGKVPGVTDPNEAETLVKEGSLTYEQAKNLAKAGNIDSLKYDATNGIISAKYAAGISVVLNFSVCLMNGMEAEDALKTSAIEGVKTGSLVFATSVIAGQLSKTGVVDLFTPSSEALVNAFGDDFARMLVQSTEKNVIVKEGESIATACTKSAARVLRTQILAAAVTTIVFSLPDAVDVFKGRISKKQFVKNFAVTAFSVAGGTAGWIAGEMVGNVIFPGAGAIPGGFIGSVIGGMTGGYVADKIADRIVQDDAEEMYEIIQKQYAQKCEEYMVNEKEAEQIADEFAKMLNEDMYKDMYKSKDREQYVDGILIPLFEDVAAKREQIKMPSVYEMRVNLKENLDGIIFIH